MEHELLICRPCAQMAKCGSCEYTAERRPVGAMPILLRQVATLMCVLALSACGETDTNVVARASHDFDGKFELFSYRAKPSEELGQAEAISRKTLGQLVSKIKSPTTIFMCLWRKIGHRKLDGDRPVEILLSCNFGPTPVETPKSLLARAEMFNTIDRAYLKASWKFQNGNYELSRFVVEILSDQKRYRSQNLAADIPQIQVVQGDMKFPQHTGDPFQFNLQSQLPYRSNSGEPQRDPIVSVSFSGVAEPIPDWVNY